MHSRTGLVTEYLGDEWFDLINLCADEAERLGMEAWIYDEDRWPSGTAGSDDTFRAVYRPGENLAQSHRWSFANSILYGYSPWSIVPRLISRNIVVDNRVLLDSPISWQR